MKDLSSSLNRFQLGSSPDHSQDLTFFLMGKKDPWVLQRAGRCDGAYGMGDWVGDNAERRGRW